MNKFKSILTATAICVLSFALSSCTEKSDDYFEFSDLGISEPNEPEVAEDVVMTTEFPEYDGNVDKIVLSVTNNSDEDFGFSDYYVLQKLDEGEWKYIKVFGQFTLLAGSHPPSLSAPLTIKLKDHIKQPLLPGQYRIGVGSINLDLSFNGALAYAEFTVK
ncbi:MAG: hypothetical protein K2N38_10375 [Oscillospiraceae bacterium]|nr:hypothetical protein [Oscillospiraceae bacterium]